MPDNQRDVDTWRGLALSILAGGAFWLALIAWALSTDAQDKKVTCRIETHGDLAIKMCRKP